MIQVTIDEAKEKFADLIDAAARAESVLIEQEAGQGEHVIQLVAVPQRQRRRRQAGSAKGTVIFMADDFDAPLEDIREYME